MQNMMMEEGDFVKLTNSVYKILDCLPDSDPLKNRAKEKALAILENVTLMRQTRGLSADEAGWVSVKSLLSPDHQRLSATLSGDIEILESYLKIGRGQGWIGAMNFSILIKEYHLIKSKLPVVILPSILVSGEDTSARGAKGDLSSPETSVANKIQESVKNTKSYSPRQSKILEILHQRQRAQVGDLIKELPKVTKRTVRRDLDELLKKGEIVRAGEWNQVFYQVKG